MDNIKKTEKENVSGNEGKVYFTEVGSDWEKGYSEEVSFEIELPFHICEQLEKIYEEYGCEEGVIQDYADEYPELIEFFKENNIDMGYEIYYIKSIFYEFRVGNIETKYYFHNDDDEINEITKEEFTENLEKGFNHWRKDTMVYFEGRQHVFNFSEEY